MKKTVNRSINWLISALIVLICLLMPILSTNAWFTAGDNQQLQIVVNIQNINFTVYQIKSGETGEGTLIKTFDENNEETDEAEKSYIDLTDASGTGVRELLPNTAYSLHLTLKNPDTGASSVYVRYKIELLINSVNTSDTALELNITGASAPSGTTGGFELNSDGYFYYRNSTGVLQYPSQANLTMLTSFSIPYSEFINNDINADTVKLVVTVETYDNSSFN